MIALLSNDYYLLWLRGKSKEIEENLYKNVVEKMHQGCLFYWNLNANNFLFEEDGIGRWWTLKYLSRKRRGAIIKWFILQLHITWWFILIIFLSKYTLKIWYFLKDVFFIYIFKTLFFHFIFWFQKFKSYRSINKFKSKLINDLSQL